MTENSSVKSLVGGEVKVLNDMVGSVTVSTWREQAERAAVRLCGETGKMMLHGTFPSVRPNTYYDKQLLIDTLMDLFKRSSKKWSATWLDEDEGEHGTIKLTQTGYIEYNMRIEVIAEDLISIIEGTTKDGSNAKKYFQSLCRRSGKSKEDNLRDFEKYSTTTMVRGAQSAKKVVGKLIRDMRVVMVEKGAQTPNPNDMAADAFTKKFKTYDSTTEDIQQLFTGFDEICDLYESLKCEDVSENAAVDSKSRTRRIIDELDFVDNIKDAVRDFTHAVDRGDMSDKSDLDVYNDLKQRLLAYERRRKDHEERHGAKDAPTVAAPVVEGKKANPNGVNNFVIRDCRFGSKCRDGPAKCIYQHRDNQGKAANDPLANRKAKFGDDGTPPPPGGKDKGKSSGSKGKGNQRGKESNEVKRLKSELATLKRKMDGGGKKDKKKVKFSEDDVKRFAKDEVEKHNQRLHAANDDPITIPAVKISDKIAMPNIKELVCMGSNATDFFEDGLYVGIDTDANVAVTNSLKGMSDVRDIPDTGPIKGIGNKSFTKMGRRTLVLPRADGRHAIIHEDCYYDPDGNVNITPALRMGDEEGYTLKLRYDQDQTMYKKPQNRPGHALKSPDGVPIWLNNKSGILVAKQAKNIDASCAMTVKGEQVLYVGAKAARAKRIEALARQRIKDKGEPMTNLQREVTEISAADKADDNPHLLVYQTVKSKAQQLDIVDGIVTGTDDHARNGKRPRRQSTSKMADEDCDDKPALHDDSDSDDNEHGPVAAAKQPDTQATNFVAACKRACDHNLAFYGYSNLNAGQKARLWQRRYANASAENMLKMSKTGMVKGVQVSRLYPTDDDATVTGARFKWKPFQPAASDHSKLPPFHSVSTDEVRGFDKETIGKAKSAFVTVCLATNYAFVDLVRNRDDYPDVLLGQIRSVGSLGDFSIRRIRSDSAGEIQQGKAAEIMATFGISPEPVAATTHQPGGKHESAIQRIVHRARAMALLAPWMPPSMWGLALKYAATVNNYTPGILHGKVSTPVERVTGIRADANRVPIRVWGCRVSYGMTKEQRSALPRKKWESLTEEHYFAGTQGNQVLLVQVKSGACVLHTGQRQRCEFHEGIYTERTPPRQSNPLTLLQQDYDNYVEVLRNQGLLEGEDAPDGVTAPPRYDKLTLASEVYERIRKRWDSVSIGDAGKFFNDNVTEDSLLPATQVTPRPARTRGEADEADVPNGDDTVTTANENDKAEPAIAERIRLKHGRQAHKPRPKRTRGARVPTNQEIQQKTQEYQDVALYDDDGDKYTVTTATLRKARGGADEWWLQLTDGDEHTFWKSERIVKADLAAAEEQRASDDDSKHAAADDNDADSVAARLRSARRQTRMAAAAALVCGTLGRDEAPPKRDWPDPKDAYQCLAAPDWKGWIRSMRSEKASWEKLGVFKVVNKRKRDHSKNTYPLQDIYTRKWHASDGSFDKHKCRLVCMGNLFKRGIDCTIDVFAPTISKLAANTFFFFACQEGKRLVKFDIKTAFLLAVSSKAWYAYYPVLFKIADMSDEEATEMRRKIAHGTDEEREQIRRWLKRKVDANDVRVLEILKSVYGDPAGNRQFWKHFQTILSSMHFSQCESEPCMHQTHERDNSVTRCLTHGDDGIVAIDDDKTDQFVTDIKKIADVTVEIDPTDFCGTRIKYDREAGRLELLMDVPINDAYNEFKDDMEGLYKTKTPMQPGSILTKATDEEHDEAKHRPYQKLVGYLIWFMTQVKIESATSVTMVGQHTSKWSNAHYKAGLHILNWMNANRHEGVVFRRTEDFNPNDCLIAFADADLAGDVDTRRSRSGKLIMIGSKTHATAISHKSGLQKLIALSTTAAEIISLMDAVTDLVAARRLCKEMGYPQQTATRVLEDNQPAIALVKDRARMEGATKHTDMRHLKLRELQAQGVFTIEYCRTNKMMADLFTKNLPAPQFKALADYITGRRGDVTSEPMIDDEGRAMLIYKHATKRARAHFDDNKAAPQRALTRAKRQRAH